MTAPATLDDGVAAFLRSLQDRSPHTRDAYAHDLAAWSSGDVDWRGTFIFLGLTGIGLAVIVRLVLKEPVRGAMEFEEEVVLKKPPFIESLKSLLKIPAWWAMCFGIAFGSFVSYAKSAFQTKFLVSLDPTFDFQTLIIILGVMNGDLRSDLSLPPLSLPFLLRWLFCAEYLQPVVLSLIF